MGCLKSKPTNRGTICDDSKYSWSKREKNINLRDYMIENEKDKNIIKNSGSINGQQFIIQNCQSVNIVLLDFMNTITIDDCSNCSIIIGPTMTSVVLRDCSNCNIMSASQQFRCRDCRNLNVFLHCASQPAIESCYKMSFGCYSFYYDQLKDQFEKANLSTFDNKWYDIYDFTVNDDEKHWTLLPDDCRAEDFFSTIKSFVPINLSFNPNDSVVMSTNQIPQHKDDSFFMN